MVMAKILNHLQDVDIRKGVNRYGDYDNDDKFMIMMFILTSNGP